MTLLRSLVTWSFWRGVWKILVSRLLYGNDGSHLFEEESDRVFTCVNCLEERIDARNCGGCACPRCGAWYNVTAFGSSTTNPNSGPGSLNSSIEASPVYALDPNLPGMFVDLSGKYPIVWPESHPLVVPVQGPLPDFARFHDPNAKMILAKRGPGERTSE